VADAAAREAAHLARYAGRLEQRVAYLEAQLGEAQQRAYTLAQSAIQPAPPPPAGAHQPLPDPEQVALQRHDDEYLTRLAAFLAQQGHLSADEALKHAKELSDRAAALYG
jgi:hypothetical protein